MKNIILLCLSFMPFLLLAQTIERQAISSGGGFTSATSIQASSTIGQTVIASEFNSSLIVTQGFQQSNEFDVAIIELESGISINAYPNPASDAVVLDFKVERPLELNIRVLDALGRELPLQNNSVYIENNMTYQLDVSNFAVGHYFIHLRDEDGLVNNTIKVQKVD